YLVSEGFALRLMPVAVEVDPQGQGLPVNTDALYDQIKNKYVWGNLKDSPYLDPESYNMVSLVRNSIYTTAAEGLLAEGRVEEARDVLDDALANLPERIFRIRDAFTYSFFIDNLYKVGLTDAANHLVQVNLDYLPELLDYYLAIAET